MKTFTVVGVNCMRRGRVFVLLSTGDKFGMIQKKNILTLICAFVL